MLTEPKNTILTCKGTDPACRCVSKTYKAREQIPRRRHEPVPVPDRVRQRRPPQEVFAGHKRLTGHP